MEKGLSQEIIKRIESIEGMNIENAAKLRYIDQQLSYRKLCDLWGVNNRTIPKILNYSGISIRHGGEAVKTQWVNNPKRRKSAGENLANINHSLALEGKHIRQGKTKENSEMIRNISEKLKVSSSFNRPEVKRKVLENSLMKRKEHPENMSALDYKPSVNERILCNFIDSIHIPYEFRKLINGYIVDIYIPSLNFAIDCFGSGHLPFSFKKHQAITSQGIHIVYCSNSFVKKACFTDLHQYITSLNTCSIDPTFRSQITVIWGARGMSPFGNDTNKFTVKRIHMNSFYKLILTATTNNDVTT